MTALEQAKQTALQEVHEGMEDYLNSTNNQHTT
jgi:hypothetical protein